MTLEDLKQNITLCEKIRKYDLNKLQLNHCPFSQILGMGYHIILSLPPSRMGVLCNDVCKPFYHKDPDRVGCPYIYGDNMKLILKEILSSSFFARSGKYWR